jgi:hypothetical protein
MMAKAVVVERKISSSFYILINPKSDKTSIRLDPLTDPEKTSGVKMALALMAKKVLKHFLPDLKVAQTNIQEFLDIVS